MRRRFDRAVDQVRRPRRIEVPANAVPGTTDGLGAGGVDPFRRPPTATALIRVRRHYHPDGLQAFGFSGVCEGVAPLPHTSGPTQLRPPAIGLGNARQGGEGPSELLYNIRLWSHNQRQLGKWINKARVVHGDELQVVIRDDTGFELPWEALWLPADPEHGLEEGLLGTLVVLSRWLTIHDLHIDFPENPADAKGRVLGYFHTGMHQDINAFKGFSHSAHKTISGFLNDLDTHPGESTGLVYMACHGTYDERLSALSLAGVTWSEYNARPMDVLDGDRSMVCLNACHSGRFVRNTGLGEDALRGFAELFLRKGAGGCIVTAGQVGEREARELIHQLVSAVTADPWQPVAQSLRDFRVRALRAFGDLNRIPRARRDDGHVDKEGQERVMRLLYSLMFQYYGHPRSTLALTAANGALERQVAHRER
ncbi:CHAT domain-containing protein [Streptomyces sp. NPDC001514]